MSCPYLERGRIALCRAVGKRGMELNPERMETDCFSGDFTRCPLLLFPPIQEPKSWRQALSSKRNSAKERGPDGWRKSLPAF
jgi:hypothetical protein